MKNGPLRFCSFTDLCHHQEMMAVRYFGPAINNNCCERSEFTRSQVVWEYMPLFSGLLLLLKGNCFEHQKRKIIEDYTSNGQSLRLLQWKKSDRKSVTCSAITHLVRSNFRTLQLPIILTLFFFNKYPTSVLELQYVGTYCCYRAVCSIQRINS